MSKKKDKGVFIVKWACKICKMENPRGTKTCGFCGAKN